MNAHLVGRGEQRVQQSADHDTGGVAVRDRVVAGEVELRRPRARVADEA
ncbi:hypothetical protein [Streptomyces mirabilis]